MRAAPVIGILLTILCVTNAPAQTVPASRADLQFSFSSVVEATAPAVVSIYVSRVVADQASPFAGDPFFSQFFGRGLETPRVQNSLGSGVIVDPSGIVVSNYHVAGDATDIRVVLSDRREFAAHVLLADEAADLAVLKIEGAERLPALQLAESESAKVGDLVLAIGNPFGVGQTVSSGIVSGLARSGGGMGGGRGYFIQTDAPINPGNSGGALVDMAGRLLGINTSILTRSGGSNGIGFAIPSDLVAAYVDQASAGKTAFTHPWAGILVQDVEPGIAEAIGMDAPRGVLVSAVHPQSPLAAAGLTAGDVLLSLNGAPISSSGELGYRLSTLTTTAAVPVEFMSDGRDVTADVALTEAPDLPPADPVEVDQGGVFGGLTVARANPRIIDHLHLPLMTQGVVVIGTGPDSGISSLSPGDVIAAINGRVVTEPSEVRTALSNPTRGLVIDLIRGGQRLRYRLG